MKKVISIIFAALMILGTFSMAAFAMTPEYKELTVDDTTYKYITFGSYPTKKVTGNMVYYLDQMADDATWTTKNYGEDATLLMTDVTRNGVKYRGIIVKQYDDAKIQRNAGYEKEKVYWFEYKDLDWRIIDEKYGVAVCTTVVDVLRYDVEASNTWENSILYNWLNDDFANTAFGSELKGYLTSTITVPTESEAKAYRDMISFDKTNYVTAQGYNGNVWLKNNRPLTGAVRTVIVFRDAMYGTGYTEIAEDLIPAGTTLKYIGSYDCFYQVEYNGKKVYVYKTDCTAPQYTDDVVTGIFNQETLEVEEVNKYQYFGVLPVITLDTEFLAEKVNEFNGRMQEAMEEQAEETAEETTTETTENAENKAETNNTAVVDTDPITSFFRAFFAAFAKLFAR